MRKIPSNAGFGNEMPPLFKHLDIYFQQQGLTKKDAEEFFQFHKARNWTTDTGHPIRNWKVAATDFIYRHKHQTRLSLSDKIAIELNKILPGNSLISIKAERK